MDEKMHEKTLTISIAAYNVEKYIGQALDSLIHSSVIDDLEIFVVDDGGTDQTIEIARAYSENYPDSIFVIHKENGGYGTTVNYSIAHATGKYFKLLDGDDWFDEEGLCHLVSKLKEVDSDVVITPFYRAEGKTIKNISYDVPWGKEMLFKEFQAGADFTFGMYSITYRTQIVQESKLSLPEKCLYTDGIYITTPISRCKTVYFLDEWVYIYRIGRNGQSMERASRVKHRKDSEKVALINCKYYEELKENNGDNLQYIKLRAAITSVGAMVSVLVSPVNGDSLRELKELDRTVMATSKDIYYAEENVGKTGRLIKLFRKTGYLPYWLLKMLPRGFPY